MHFEAPDVQLCIEELVVPVSAAMYVRQSTEADLLRDSAQHLCSLPQLPSRVESRSLDRASQLSVVFFQRAVDRLVLNAAELCRSLALNGIPDPAGDGRRISIDAWQATEHLDPCADLHELWPADVIVSVHGTHEILLSFLRPGTVAVKIYPRKMCACWISFSFLRSPFLHLSLLTTGICQFTVHRSSMRGSALLRFLRQDCNLHRPSAHQIAQSGLVLH